MPYLLQIHIGPVQAFIAAARRTRDLWFGSWVLSERSKAAAEAIAKEVGTDALVFPAPFAMEDLKPNSDLSVSNKVVAEINQSHDKVAEIARKAREAVTNRLWHIFENSLQNKTKAELQPSWNVIVKQLNDFDEFYWVAVPYEEEEYKEARKKADRLLAARKNTRTFGKVTWGSHLPKSSLDGKRESVLPDMRPVIKELEERYTVELQTENYTDEELERRVKAKIKTYLQELWYELYRAKYPEELSGIDLLKRLGKKDKQDQASFPSTSHMAARPLAHQLDTTQSVKGAWDAYMQVLQGISANIVKEERCYLENLQLPNLGDADGSLLYESRLLDYLKGHDLRRAKRALGKFFDRTGISRPYTYYALLVGDGDFMGKSIDHLTTKIENQKFSCTLSEFASEAKHIIRQHDGEPIYTGGDDVIALLPVHKAVLCAYELSVEFAVRMGLEEFARDDMGNTPTFSAGIAIVHHLEPLEDALELARKAEKEAKGVDGKNALAVSLDKRSGAVRTVKGKWGDEGEMVGLNGRLHTFAQYHYDDLIPDRMAYQIQETMMLLGGRKASKNDYKIKQIIQLEALRIMKRKKDGAKAVTSDIEDKIMKALNYTEKIADFINEIIIAKAIAEAMKLEENPKKKEATR